MKRIKLSFHNLRTLKDANPKLRKAIISNCDSAINVLRGNVRMTNCQKKRLQKFKRQLRTVVGKRVPLASKKRLINQRGGFLVPLLSAVLPTLAVFIYNSLNHS